MIVKLEEILKWNIQQINSNEVMLRFNSQRQSIHPIRLCRFSCTNHVVFASSCLEILTFWLLLVMVKIVTISYIFHEPSISKLRAHRIVIIGINHLLTWKGHCGRLPLFHNSVFFSFLHHQCCYLESVKGCEWDC